MSHGSDSSTDPAEQVLAEIYDEYCRNVRDRPASSVTTTPIVAPMVYKTGGGLYTHRMNAEPTRPIPEEISVSDARASLGELVEAAAMGKVIHLTKHGRRIAAIVPERSQAEVDEAFMASVDKIVDRYREMFDRLAEL